MAHKSETGTLSEAGRDELISKLANELPALRTKMGLSQDEMGNLLGITRQTYSSIETKKRKMSWSLYLALILILGHCSQTHEYVHQSGLFPRELFPPKTGRVVSPIVKDFLNMETDEIKNKLDEHAIHAIETVIMIEYARCNNLSGDTVIKAFDGKRQLNVSDQDLRAQRALDNIRAGMNRNDSWLQDGNSNYPI